LACPQEPIPVGWKVWRGPVPPELTTFAMEIRDRIRSYARGTIAATKHWRGQDVAAFVSSHSWTYRQGTLVTGICIAGVSLLQPQPPGVGVTNDPGLSVPDPDAATWTGPAFDWVDTLLGVAIGALGVMWWRSMR
jgi:hypothetical protein